MLPEISRDARRILAVRLDNIGDVVMLSPALRALKEAFPAAGLTLLASHGGAQAAQMLPWVDQVIPWKASWQDISRQMENSAGQEHDLVRLLQQGRYDAAFIFTSFNQSPYPPAYTCYLAGIPVRVGQSKEFGGALLTHWVRPQQDSQHQVERNLHLLRSAGIAVLDDHIALSIPRRAGKSARDILQAKGIPPGRAYIAIAPGASARARRYPAERFLMATRKITARTGLPAIILGSPGETETLKPFQRAAGRDPSIIWLVGQTGLSEMAAVIKRASLVMANNSAALHIAEAFCQPMVILYSGSEHLSQWSPRYAPALILNRPVSCSPCYAFDCPYQLECLGIAPEEVARETIAFMNRGAGPAQAAGSPPSLLTEANV